MQSGRKSLFDKPFRLRVACDFKGIFGEKRQEGIGGIVAGRSVNVSRR